VLVHTEIGTLNITRVEKLDVLFCIRCLQLATVSKNPLTFPILWVQIRRSVIHTGSNRLLCYRLVSSKLQISVALACRLTERQFPSRSNRFPLSLSPHGQQRKPSRSRTGFVGQNVRLRDQLFAVRTPAASAAVDLDVLSPVCRQRGRLDR
jgi:hypothetical protein